LLVQEQQPQQPFDEEQQVLTKEFQYINSTIKNYIPGGSKANDKE
jgi:hypothetical protein